MRRLLRDLVLTLSLGSLTALGAGCSSSAAKGDGGGGSGGVLILPSTMGFVDGTNSLGILGPWYAYGDNWADDGTPGGGKCETVGMNASTACSSLTTPAPGQPFAPADDPVTTGKMCANGIAAAIIDDAAASPDYSNIFGVGIGLDLNNAGTADGGVGKLAYDAPSHGITGFKFDIDTPPLNALRVEFPTTASGNDSAYWNGMANNVSPVKAGTNTVPFASVNGPMYLPTAPAFDATKLLSIQFHVIPSAGATTPFNFCVSNLTAITN